MSTELDSALERLEKAVAAFEPHKAAVKTPAKLDETIELVPMPPHEPPAPAVTSTPPPASPAQAPPLNDHVPKTAKALQNPETAPQKEDDQVPKDRDVSHPPEPEPRQNTSPSAIIGPAIEREAHDRQVPAIPNSKRNALLSWIASKVRNILQRK